MKKALTREGFRNLNRSLLDITTHGWKPFLVGQRTAAKPFRLYAVLSGSVAQDK